MQLVAKRFGTKKRRCPLAVEQCRGLMGADEGPSVARRMVKENGVDSFSGV